MKPLYLDPFDTFDLSLREQEAALGEIGLFLVAKMDTEDTRLAERISYLYREIKAGHVVTIGLSKLKIRPLLTLDCHVTQTDGRTLSVRDYVRLHPETKHAENEFVISADGGDIVIQCRQMLSTLVDILRHIKPILQGYSWENVLIDFQGWK